MINALDREQLFMFYLHKQIKRHWDNLLTDVEGIGGQIL